MCPIQQSVAQLLLQDRKIGCLITDDDLRVLEFSGNEELLRDIHVSAGPSLPELFPELIGSESILAEILAGMLPRFELRWVNRDSSDGNTIYVTMTDLPHRGPDGQIRGVIHVVEDESVLVTLEQQLAQRHNDLRLLQDRLAQQNQELARANMELKQLDQARSMFVSVAAHELRTPLTPINGYVEMLLQEEMGPLSDRQRRSLESVRFSVMRLVRITNELLDVSRIEAGRIELTLRPADLQHLVAAAVEEFQPQLEAKSQRLSVALAERLPIALCDESRVIQIIGNLLSNASKYTPAGGLIAIRAVPAEDEGFVQLSVIDNGLGISREDQAQLFKHFSRTGSARTSGASGAGLGLYIARSLVELHGGRIWLVSEPGEGSAFHLTLPIAAGPGATSSSETASGADIRRT